MRVYRGREGQWAWALHRVSGLGVLAFLCLHLVDTSLLLAGEAADNHLIRAVYQQWWFQPMEIALGAALLFHALNGLRVILIDFWDRGVRYERRLWRATLVLFVLLTVPLAAAMLAPFVAAARLWGAYTRLGTGVPHAALSRSVSAGHARPREANSRCRR